MYKYGRLIQIQLLNVKTNKSVTIDNLHMSFIVKKSKTEDSAAITIHNPGSATLEMLKSKYADVKIIIMVGYQDEGLSMIHKGDLLYAYNDSSPPDPYVSIESSSGIISKTNSKLSVSFKPGTSSLQILKGVVKSFKDLTNKENLQLSTTKPTTMLSGYTFVGNSRCAMDALCKSLGLTWNIYDDGIKVYPINKGDGSTIVVLDSSSGLLGSPKIIKATDDKYVKNQQYEVSSLLLAKTSPGNIIKVSTKKFTSGNLVVVSLEHKGDNYEGDFITTLQTEVL